MKRGGFRDRTLGMRHFLWIRNVVAALAASMAAASLSGCMDFPGTTATGGGTGAPQQPEEAPRAPAAKLVINEFDYDQAGADNAEFVEIVNPNAAAVDLTDYRIEMINGSNGRKYGTYAPPEGSLPAGGYFVIADADVIAALPAGTASMPLKSGGLQNGPDGIRIVEAGTGRVLDGVHYLDSVPGAGEGRPAPKDDTAAPASIGRCNGADSDDNGADFAAMIPTPGAANACAGPGSG